MHMYVMNTKSVTSDLLSGMLHIIPPVISSLSFFLPTEVLFPGQGHSEVWQVQH